MDIMVTSLAEAVRFGLDPYMLLIILAGVLWGSTAGALPGITSVIAIGVMVPFTFGLLPIYAVAFLVAINVGASFGNSIPAILVGLPGTPSAVLTAIDGYALHRQGKTGLAMGVTFFASVVGQFISIFLFLLMVVPLSGLTYVFLSPRCSRSTSSGSRRSSRSRRRHPQGPDLGRLRPLDRDGRARPAHRGVALRLRHRRAARRHRHRRRGDRPAGGQRALPLDAAELPLGRAQPRSSRRSFRRSARSGGWRRPSGSAPDRQRHRCRSRGQRHRLGRDLLPAVQALVPAPRGVRQGIGRRASPPTSRPRTPARPARWCRPSASASRAAARWSILLGALLIHGFVPGPMMIREAPELLHACVAGLLGRRSRWRSIGWPIGKALVYLVRLDRTFVLVGALGLTMVGDLHDQPLGARGAAHARLRGRRLLHAPLRLFGRRRLAGRRPRRGHGAQPALGPAARGQQHRHLRQPAVRPRRSCCWRSASWLRNPSSIQSARRAAAARREATPRRPAKVGSGA